MILVHIRNGTSVIALYWRAILKTAVDDEYLATSSRFIAFVGANSFAHNSMNVRMNSHLQAPQLRFPDLIRTLINPEENIQAIASMQYIARMPYMKSQLVIKDRVRKGDALIERVVWVVPAPLRGCSHCFKYRLYCGQNGATVVRYDNESGKGDHRHLGKNERQHAYLFTTLEQLFMDFEADVTRLLGGKDESDH